MGLEHKKASDLDRCSCRHRGGMFVKRGIAIADGHADRCADAGAGRNSCSDRIDGGDSRPGRRHLGRRL
jgi:hypothetical protein